MFGKLFRGFGSKKAKAASDPASLIYSAVYNETTAQGHALGKETLDLITHSLDSASTHPTEPPMLRAIRAYAGFKKVEPEFSGILTETMKEWIAAHHGSAIQSLGIQAEIDDLLPQAVEPSLERFLDRAESLFRFRTAELLQQEIMWRLHNHDISGQYKFQPPPWAEQSEIAGMEDAVRKAEEVSESTPATGSPAP